MMDLHRLQTDEESWMPPMMDLHRLQTDEDSFFSRYGPLQSERLQVQVPNQATELLPEASMPPMMELHRLQTDEDTWFSQYAPSQTEQFQVQVPVEELRRSQTDKEAAFSQYIQSQWEKIQTQALDSVDKVTDVDPQPQVEPQHAQVPNQVIEALHKLQDLVKESRLTRADLITNKATGELYPFIPLDDEGKVTSLGSILHAEHICKPCSFWKNGKCKKDDLCVYCHIEHDTRIIPDRKRRLNKVRKS
eukprot:gnl/MRDRNA2_/MRDRNA2_75771_c0_seq1.p1 gnl/MRDRNA2_/MRDRNA2_75771_c0~~gnl/MRDRNA2_/MRDRNA2_75771_c0_seq1.p1  ORF type:complete len:248 (+),score=56.59 gnl/MRDRNA2_/MRDRNA2_75771_c0_seq1:2-745(+)